MKLNIQRWMYKWKLKNEIRRLQRLLNNLK
jgi:hypothetical protein